MTRRFHFAFRPAGHRRMNEPPRVVKPSPPRVEIQTTVTTSDPHSADWSRAEIKALANTTEEDFADTRAWLSRLGMSEALNAFDS